LLFSDEKLLFESVENLNKEYDRLKRSYRSKEKKSASQTVQPEEVQEDKSEQAQETTSKYSPLQDDQTQKSDLDKLAEQVINSLIIF